MSEYQIPEFPQGGNKHHYQMIRNKGTAIKDVNKASQKESRINDSCV